jgi:hypothetical protein
LLGANKSIVFKSPTAKVTLNPADTVSSYHIFYNGGDGIVTVGYTRKPIYSDGGCGRDLIVEYDTHVSSTTFSDVQLNNESFNQVYAKITR